MSNQFNEITEKILKSIGEQNKKLEYIEEKIEKIIVEKVKEFLSSEDISLSTETSHSEIDELLIKGMNKRIKEIEDKLNSNNKSNLSNSEKKLKTLEEKFEKLDSLYKKQEKRLQDLEKNRILTEDSVIENDNSLAIKKDGKIVNITINV